MRLLSMLAIGASIFVTACGSSPAPATNEADLIAANIPMMARNGDSIPKDAPSQVAETTPYPIEACKAAIAAINGRDPATISGKKLSSGLIHVSYIRPDDGKRWQSRCRINGPDRLTWAAFDAFGDGQQGRWRDEDDVRFKVEGKNMHITLSMDGELVNDETYPLSKLD